MHFNGMKPAFGTLSTVANPLRSVAKGLSASFSYVTVQVDTGHPSWQSPHDTESHDAHGADRHCGGTSSKFFTPPIVAHLFREVASGLSTIVSYAQSDGGQPSWQKPQGTSPHDAHGAGRHLVGVCPEFRTPSTVVHPFRDVAPPYRLALHLCR